jgi:filamentous hemagglutinin family protein
MEVHAWVSALLFFGACSQNEAKPLALTTPASLEERVFKVADGGTVEFERLEVADGETLVFEQPSRQSIAVVAVRGEQPARLLGKLRANGQIVLACPRGLFVGPHAEILAAGFRVEAETGGVSNYGRVSARGGTVQLRARTIAQHGTLEAESDDDRTGHVELEAAGEIHLASTSIVSARGGSRGLSPGGRVRIKAVGSFLDEPGSRVDASGGAEGGGGGGIELCAKTLPAICSSLTAAAEPGWPRGQLLLDPEDIILTSSPNSSSNPAGTIRADDFPGQALRINVNVAFAGFAQILLQANHDILLESGTVWNLNQSTGLSDPGSRVTMEAAHNFVVGNNARILAGNGWSIAIAAGADFTGPLHVVEGTGGIYFNGGPGGAGNGSIESLNGSIELVAGLEVIVGSGFVRTTGGGSITVTTLAGDVDTGTKRDWYAFLRTGYVISPAGLGGIGTAAGGDVSITTGRDILSVAAMCGTYGLGNLSLTAGRRALGAFLVRNGTGTLAAGTDVGMSAAPVSLHLVQGRWEVLAAGDIFLNEVLNPNGSLNANRLVTGARIPFQFDYAQDASVSLQAGQSVQLLGSNPARTAGNQDRPPIYPPRLEITCGSGGLLLGNDLILYPSSQGQLSLRTTDGGSFRSTAGHFYQFVMSDSGGADYHTFSSGHAPIPLHASDPDVAACDIAGDVENLLLRVPTQMTANIGGRTVNFCYEGQNLGPAGETTLHVAGDVFNRGDRTVVRLASAPNFGIFAPAVTVRPDLAGRLSFNSSTFELELQGILNSADLEFLLHPVVYLADPFTGGRRLDANGNPILVAGQFTFDAAGLQALFALSQDVPVSPLARSGMVIGGVGNFTITADNLDLGITAGIRSVGPLLNPALITSGLGGANLRLVLRGTLQTEHSQVASLALGGIDITAGGSVYLAPSNTLGHYCPAGTVCGVDASHGFATGVPSSTEDTVPRGIYSAGGGNVSVVASNTIGITGSRIAAYDGGDVFVQAIAGNLITGPEGQGHFIVVVPYLDPLLGQLRIDNLPLGGNGILAGAFPRDTNTTGFVSLLAGGSILVDCDGISAPQTPALLLEAGADVLAKGVLPPVNTTIHAGGAVLTRAACAMFITEPVSQTVNEGATVTFTALAINATRYQWRKNGINIANEIGPTLELHEVSRQSEGDYSVMAETDIGLATSSNATLRVLIAQRMDPPQLQSDGTVLITFGDHDGGVFSPADAAGFEIQTSTNLVDWFTFPIFLSTQGSDRFGFQDIFSAEAPQRFYRVVPK